MVASALFAMICIGDIPLREVPLILGNPYFHTPEAIGS